MIFVKTRLSCSKHLQQSFRHPYKCNYYYLQSPSIATSVLHGPLQAASGKQRCPFLILSPAVSLSFARRQASLTKLVQVLEFGVTLIRICTAPETLSWASAAQKWACIHFSPRRATRFSIENLIDGDKKWRGCHRRTRCRASRRRNRSRGRTCDCRRRYYWARKNELRCGAICQTLLAA